MSSFDAGAQDLVLDDDALYAALDDGQIIALQPSRGVEDWRINLPGRLKRAPLSLGQPPTTGSETLFVETTGPDESREYVHAIDPTNGDTRWIFDESGSLGVEDWVNDTVYVAGAMPVLSPGASQDPDHDARLHALDSKTGNERWHQAIQDPTGIDAAEHGVYAGDGATLRAFSHDGTQRWTLTAANNEVRPTVVGNRVLFGATKAGDIGAYEPTTGEPRWTVTAWGDGPEGIAVTEDRIYLTSDHLMALSHEGRKLWQNDRGGSLQGIPVTSDPLYIERAHAAAALSAENGRQQWSFNPPEGEFVHARAVTETGLVVNWENGRDYEYVILDADTGTPKFRFATGFPFYASAVRDSRIFIGSEGHLYAVDVPTP